MGGKCQGSSEDRNERADEEINSWQLAMLQCCISTGMLNEHNSDTSITLTGCPICCSSAHGAWTSSPGGLTGAIRPNGICHLPSIQFSGILSLTTFCRPHKLMLFL